MEDFDLSEFHGVFFDEADEHLTSMETLLLELNLEGADPEQLNAIFRAAHSIKGGAGAFGFKDISELTHEMETVFDRVRKGQMPLSRALIDVFLASGDMLKSMIAARKGDGDAVPLDDVTALCVRLRAFLEPAVTPAAAANAPAAAANATPNPTLNATATPSQPPAVSPAAQSVPVAAEPPMADTAKAAQAPVEHPVTTPVLGAAVASAAPDNALREDKAFGLFVDPATLPANALASATELAPSAANDTPAATDKSVPGDMSAPGESSPVRNPEIKLVEQKTAAKAPVAQGDASSIRVSVQKVDELINLVGELVITQAMLAQTASHSDPVLYESLFNGLAQLQRNTRDLQESAMSIRMLPMSFVFGRFPRVVRDLAAKLGKQVDLETEGEATELDKGLIEKLTDPLTHLVRNSLDHGIESPAAREAAGKPAKGTITLRAFHRGGNIMVEVVDDGAGLNRDRLLAKARERGMNVSDAMSDQEVYQLIFEAGFSTAAQVTDVSGRGVGMDVVRRNIREMGGNVEISSVLGGGTRISIRLPLTLAILDGMSVGVGKEVFIIPLTHITESLQPAREHLKNIAGRGRVVQVRGEYVPVLALHEVFNLQPKVREIDKGIVVILESEAAKTALFVDELLGQHQVVIKSLETNYRKVAGVSGATIMGDGRVALILDVAGLINAARAGYAKVA